jgi:glycosyltransferase involved in cell wall biosynthesis
VQIVPFGVDHERVAPAPLPAVPTILFIGRLERAKGVRELIEAFARVRSDLASTRLVVAGEGPERSWIERRAAELGLDGSLRLTGAVDHAEVSRLLGDASLLCAPSHGEPFGMTILEAMAAARPVVAVAEGGSRYLVDDPEGGRLVPRDDVASLASALQSLLVDRAALARIGSHNRQKAAAQLSHERMVMRLENVYAAVAGMETTS